MSEGGIFCFGQQRVVPECPMRFDVCANEGICNCTPESLRDLRPVDAWYVHRVSEFWRKISEAVEKDAMDTAMRPSNLGLDDAAALSAPPVSELPPFDP